MYNLYMGFFDSLYAKQPLLSIMRHVCFLLYAGVECPPVILVTTHKLWCLQNNFPTNFQAHEHIACYPVEYCHS